LDVGCSIGTVAIEMAHKGYHSIGVDFDDKALVALTLLIASSDPTQKDLLIRLVINLLADDKGR